MADSEGPDLDVLAKILSTYVAQRRDGKNPKYLYLPPGGVVRLADEITWVINAPQRRDGFPVFCGMVLIERPELAENHLEAFVSENPLDAH